MCLSHGQTWDEWEHVHFAWLMSIRGQRPLTDFFQHHLPLTWHLLRSYFLLGGQGAGALYFGRTLVIASLGLTAYFASRAATIDRPWRAQALLFPMALIALTSTLLPTVWVI